MQIKIGIKIYLMYRLINELIRVIPIQKVKSINLFRKNRIL